MTDAQIRIAASFWARGNDTFAIAKLMGLPEHVVANRLRDIRETARSSRSVA